jgi:hypothetical protein
VVSRCSPFLVDEGAQRRCDQMGGRATSHSVAQAAPAWRAHLNVIGIELPIDHQATTPRSRRAYSATAPNGTGFRQMHVDPRVDRTTQHPSARCAVRPAPHRPKVQHGRIDAVLARQRATRQPITPAPSGRKSDQFVFRTCEPRSRASACTPRSKRRDPTRQERVLAASDDSLGACNRFTQRDRLDQR